MNQKGLLNTRSCLSVTAVPILEKKKMFHISRRNVYISANQNTMLDNGIFYGISWVVEDKTWTILTFFRSFPILVIWMTFLLKSSVYLSGQLQNICCSISHYYLSVIIPKPPLRICFTLFIGNDERLVIVLLKAAA